MEKVLVQDQHGRFYILDESGSWSPAPESIYEQQWQTSSSPLWTDLYQLTMAQGYFLNDMHNQEAVFNLYFRKPPFGGSYAITAGLQTCVDFIRNYQFTNKHLTYLENLSGNDGKALFDGRFLDYLSGLKLSCDIDAIPEGTVAFPNEPLIRVKGSIVEGQLLETPFLYFINFATLVATKTARICQVARNASVLEFGFRRSQGGHLSVVRSAYIGGAIGTSNVEAARVLGIPAKGTHAHSWVMSFPSELEAFEAYANTLPNNCVFLVDTYNTIEGIKNAIKASKRLEGRGYKAAGIRLDSGDLTALSIAARQMLNDANLGYMKIVASNDLNEYKIEKMVKDHACIDIYGVGTELATCADQPALGGVYKLAAIKNGEKWDYKVKLSEDSIKTSIPGMQQVRRCMEGYKYKKDIIYDEIMGGEFDSPGYDLLIPIVRRGEIIRDQVSLELLRDNVARNLQCLPEEYKQLKSESRYVVELESGLAKVRDELIKSHKV